MLQEKIGDIHNLPEDMEDVTTRNELQLQEDTKSENSDEQPSTEEDLVGVTQVAYIQPDADPEEDPECITLPPEAEHANKQACTLSTVQLKKEAPDSETVEQETEHIFVMEDTDDQMQESPDVVADANFDAIADAVKAALSNQPGLNLAGELHMKVQHHPGKPTQVEVTTEDGSLIVMELVAEDDPDVPELPDQEVGKNDLLLICKGGYIFSSTRFIITHETHCIIVFVVFTFSTCFCSVVFVF